MRCIDCVHYEERPNEADDRCLHPKSKYTIQGIREESVEAYRTCGSMLDFICSNHCMFEARSGAVSGTGD
jgi:hypothetical protein